MHQFHFFLLLNKQILWRWDLIPSSYHQLRVYYAPLSQLWLLGTLWLSDVHNGLSLPPLISSCDSSLWLLLWSQSISYFPLLLLPYFSQHCGLFQRTLPSVEKTAVFSLEKVHSLSFNSELVPLIFSSFLCLGAFQFSSFGLGSPCAWGNVRTCIIWIPAHTPNRGLNAETLEHQGWCLVLYRN